MNLRSTILRIEKLTRVVLSRQLLRALIRSRVLAGVEHMSVFPEGLATVVDIGANRGQFALSARRWVPEAHIISFEPLPGPAAVFRKVFSCDKNVLLHEAAIGPGCEVRTMHVSQRDDSSSLFPISSVQTTIFPGTEEQDSISVRVAPLKEFTSVEELKTPAMLKLDVQGFEYEALVGCESLLHCFDLVYCECSFMELYSGQKLAHEVIDWLSIRGFGLAGFYNPHYDRLGKAVQADCLFRRDITH